MSLIVLTGGARSGKSTLAVQIGERSTGSVTFIATAPGSSSDDAHRDSDIDGAIDSDMDGRIARHIAERPAHWTTVEEQIDIATAIEAAPDGLVIVDCLTLWTSNLMWADHDDASIDELARSAAHAASSRRADVVVVTNEVGLGIVPVNDVARRYRDVHGRVNQRFVSASDQALHLTAGRAHLLVDPWALLQ